MGSDCIVTSGGSSGLDDGSVDVGGSGTTDVIILVVVVIRVVILVVVVRVVALEVVGFGVVGFTRWLVLHDEPPEEEWPHIRFAAEMKSR